MELSGKNIVIEGSAKKRGENSVERSLEDFIARANSTYLDLAPFQEPELPAPEAAPVLAKGSGTAPAPLASPSPAPTVNAAPAPAPAPVQAAAAPSETSRRVTQPDPIPMSVPKRDDLPSPPEAVRNARASQEITAPSTLVDDEELAAALGEPSDMMADMADMGDMGDMPAPLPGDATEIVPLHSVARTAAPRKLSPYALIAVAFIAGAAAVFVGTRLASPGHAPVATTPATVTPAPALQPDSTLVVQPLAETPVIMAAPAPAPAPTPAPVVAAPAPTPVADPAPVADTAAPAAEATPVPAPQPAPAPVVAKTEAKPAHAALETAHGAMNTPRAKTPRPAARAERARPERVESTPPAAKSTASGTPSGLVDPFAN